MAVSRPGQDIRDPEVLKRPTEDHPAGWWAKSEVLGNPDLLKKIHSQGFEPEYTRYGYNRGQC